MQFFDGDGGGALMGGGGERGHRPSWRGVGAWSVEKGIHSFIHITEIRLF